MIGKLIIIMAIFQSFFLCNCGLGQPTISSISPDSKVIHMPAFKLIVTGSGFKQDSKVIFNGVEKVTVAVDTTELTCQIEAYEISTGPAILPVLVRTPNEDDSNIVHFTFYEQHTFTTPQIVTNQLSQWSRITNYDIIVDHLHNINIAWCEGWPIGLEGYVYYTRSENLGNTWINTQDLTHPPNTWGSFWPGLAVEAEDKIYLICNHQESSRGRMKMCFTRSFESGTTWDPHIHLPHPNFHFFSWSSDIIFDKSTQNLYVVHDMTPINADQFNIYFRKSTDRGNTWNMVNISQNDVSSLARIAVDGDDNIHVVWYEQPPEDPTYNSLVYRRSIDQGNTWEPAVNMETARDVSPGKISTDDGKGVVVFWNLGPWQSNDQSSFFICSYDGGVNWNSATFFMDLPVSGMEVDSVKNINIVYHDFNDNVFFIRSTDFGNTWEAAINIPLIKDAKIALDNEGNIYIIGFYNDSLYFFRSEI